MIAKSTAICVLGMHRSGTSLFSKLSMALGVYMGHESDMLDPREDNPEGFWELSEIVDFHERLLKSMNYSWDTTKPLPDKWWLSEEVEPFKIELRSIIDKYFSNQSLWGWKDPRTCLTLPLWKLVLEELDIEIRYLVCLRNPLNVAASLRKRDKFTIEKSMAMWSVYTLTSLYYTRDQDRILIDYDGLLENSLEVGEHICQFIGIEYGETQRTGVRSSINHGLSHGNSKHKDLLQSPETPLMIKELYQNCLDVCENMNELNIRNFNEYVESSYRSFLETLSLWNHQKSNRMQIYWTIQGESFTEAHSAYCTTTLNNEFIEYTIPITYVPGTKLRIDPLNEIGFVNITRIIASNGNNSIDLLKTCQIEFANFVKFSRNSKRINGISMSNDPQIILSGLPLLQGDVVIQIEMSISLLIGNDLVEFFENSDENDKMYERVISDSNNKTNTIEFLMQRVKSGEHERMQLMQLYKGIKRRYQAAHRRINNYENKFIRYYRLLLEKDIYSGKLSEGIDYRQYEIERLNKLLEDLTEQISYEHSAAQNLNEINWLKEREYLKTFREKDERLRLKEQEIEHYKAIHQLYEESLSWRLTKPLRYLGRAVRGGKLRLKAIIRSSIQTYTIYTNKKKEITDLLNKMKYGKYVLIISHTNYLESMGGTEKYIFEQAAYLAENKTGIIQVFPGKFYSFLDHREDAYYGILIDETFVGYYPIDIIVNFVANQRLNIEKMYTHHLLNWQYRDYISVLKKIGSAKVLHILLMHDFFSLCTSYHMMKESDSGTKSCIPEIQSSLNSIEEVCMNCKYHVRLKEWRNAFKEITGNVDHIVVPSDFVKETAVSVYPDLKEKILVWSHLKFVNSNKVRIERTNSKIKLAFLGYRMNNKGWAVWEKLYNNKNLREIYEFHHVGSLENYSEYVIMHQYSFITNGRMAAVEILENKQIDVALLWSIVPESYSYTLQEAVAAGVPVLTSPKSGNIARYLDLNPELGKVLNNEDNLFEFLADTDAVRAFISIERQRYELAYNFLPFD